MRNDGQTDEKGCECFNYSLFHRDASFVSSGTNRIRGFDLGSRGVQLMVQEQGLACCSTLAWLEGLGQAEGMVSFVSSLLHSSFVARSRVADRLSPSFLFSIPLVSLISLLDSLPFASTGSDSESIHLHQLSLPSPHLPPHHHLLPSLSQSHPTNMKPTGTKIANANDRHRASEGWRTR